VTSELDLNFLLERPMIESAFEHTEERQDLYVLLPLQ